jgi:hypothetical protein
MGKRKMEAAFGEPMERSKKCDERFGGVSTRFNALLIGRTFPARAHLLLASVMKEKYTTRDDFALR